MSAFVSVRVVEDDELHETKRAIRASDVYEIEECGHYRVVRRNNVDDLLERVDRCLMMGMPFACGGCE